MVDTGCSSCCGVDISLPTRLSLRFGCDKQHSLPDAEETENGIAQHDRKKGCIRPYGRSLWAGFAVAASRSRASVLPHGTPYFETT